MFLLDARDTAHAKAQRLESTDALADQKVGCWALSGEMHSYHCWSLHFDEHLTRRQSLAYQHTSQGLCSSRLDYHGVLLAKELKAFNP